MNTRRTPSNKKTPSTPLSPPPIATLHPIVRWMRAAGIVGLLVGLSSVFFSGWFWIGVAVIYASLAVILTDLWFEPELSKRWKIAATALLFLIAALFSWGIVIVPAPLGIEAIITDGEYPPGTDVNGIQWHHGLTELRVNIYNQSDRDYEDFSVLLQPTAPIAKILQSTNISNVLFYDKYRLQATVTNNQTAFPVVLLATDAGYLMNCSLLPARTSIGIEIALADMKNPAPDGVVRIQMADRSTYWFGPRDADAYSSVHPNTQVVQIQGDYQAAFRKRTISQTVQVAGHVPPELKFR